MLQIFLHRIKLLSSIFICKKSKQNDYSILYCRVINKTANYILFIEFN